MFFKRRNNQKPNSAQKPRTERPSIKVTRSLDKNIDFIVNEFNNSDDLKVRKIKKIDATLIYFESLVDQDKMQDRIFKPIELSQNLDTFDLSPARVSHDLYRACNSLLMGHTLLLKDHVAEIKIIPVTDSNNRNVDEPANERVVRGSHEGFIENLMVNLNLLRKRMNDSDLTVHYFDKGTETSTKIAVVFMNSLVNDEHVKEVERRIQSIDADMLFSPGYIEEFIEDEPMSPFPQLLNTERPDRVEANILEGRIAILAEGSPTCLLTPVSFFAFYQTTDDYNNRWTSGTFLRLIRLTSFLIAIGLPAIYIAVVGFHFEVIPSDLLLPVKASINDIPYPPLIEALVMVIVIELIRESGMRLPSPVGQTIGIVGGLVIGDAVVKAGLVSNLVVVVIALTALASFVVPSNEMSTTLRVLTFPLIILAGTFGFVGIAFGFLALLIHLARLTSLGTPYFAPMTPFRLKDLKDTFVRIPLFKMNRRPTDNYAKKSVITRRSRKWDMNE
ncbi:spore germination protein [Halalkalibacillus sediminis]|nr:spore germination protein [Halalkalibacillus sediminis]